MKSHIGFNTSLGKGAIYIVSYISKLNTMSYTEANLVAMDKAMRQI